MIRRVSSLGLGFAVTLAALGASAQGAPSANPAPTTTGHRSNSALGADAGALVLVSNSNTSLLSDTHLLVGGVVKLEVDATPSVGLTGRVGFFYGFAKPNRGFSDLPVWIGARFYLEGGGEGFHAGAEFGLNQLAIRNVDYMGRPKIIDSSGWGANIPLGYRSGGLDVQAQLSVLTLTDHPADSVVVGLTLGYDFGI